VINAYLWTTWCRDLLRVSPFKASWGARAILAGNVLLCLSLILVVLLTVSSQDVRGDPYYVVLYELVAALWLAGALRLFPLLGISVRDDVLERHNPSAFWAMNGALIGVAAAFAGGNVGNGPGSDVVIFCAAISSLSFFLAWLLLEVVGAYWSEAVTVERDPGSGIRFGAVLAATGFGFGSAVTGDWVSATVTLRHLIERSWPILPTFCLALSLERVLRRSPGAFRGWLAAALYLGIAILCVAVERRMR
jgi:hypothetical protein